LQFFSYDEVKGQLLTLNQGGIILCHFLQMILDLGFHVDAAVDAVRRHDNQEVVDAQDIVQVQKVLQDLQGQ